MTDQLLTTLRSLFGFDTFRPGQARAIQTLLEGRHLLVVMPTGSGKSLIYQLAGLYLPGVTLVISPLIALMKDQVDGLTDRGVPAAFINSTLSSEEQARRLEALTDGTFRLAFVAPERLRSLRFQEALSRLTVSLLAVDEAHCLSQWGHDFRPDYLYIAAARRHMGTPVTVALTATATPRVQDEIVRLLGLPVAERMVLGFDRPNLTFEVFHTPDVIAKLQMLRGLLASRNGGAAIVYVGTRHDSEEITAFVREVCGLRACSYHAGLEAERRKKVQEEFVAGRLPAVVATCAFGLGIDHPEVRLVVHFTLPGSLETYYQEAGRGGRDGRPARAVLLYRPGDRRLQEWFIEHNIYRTEELRRIDQALRGKGRTELWQTSEELATTTGLSPVKVRVGLAQLEMAGAVQRLGDIGRTMWLRLGEWNEAAVEASANRAEELRARRQEELMGMIGYAKAPGCRRRYLLEYFGDRVTEPEPRCCDNCAAKRSAVSFIHSLAGRVLRRFARWFAGPVPRAIAKFLARTEEQPLSGPWSTGYALGLYHRISGANDRRTLIGGLLYRLKYCGEMAALPYLVRGVVGLCAAHPELRDVDGLVPVPPSTRRSRDVVSSLALALGPQLGRPVWPVLTKTRWTGPQKSMRTLSQKQANVAGAFAVAADVRGLRLLVVDDLYDSGATLAEASRVLHAAGVAGLCVVALARTHRWQE
jgi:ATP-dependent DNA helicase RecQ